MTSRYVRLGVIRRKAAALLYVLAAVCGATESSAQGRAPAQASHRAELGSKLLPQNPDLYDFRSPGPFKVSVRNDVELRVARSEGITADVYVAAVNERAPLVVFVHGFESTKRAHSRQAAHVASWGMHALTLQVPNHGPWISNGDVVANVIRLIHATPRLITERPIDANAIVLVGHSFGASSVVVALAAGTPAVGAVLLDPASSDRDLPGFLRRISTPVLILGADEELSPTRDRAWFYRYIRRNVGEVSVRGAVHEDAQYPSDFALQFGTDPDTTEELQVTFTSAIVAAALSLSGTGRLDYAWRTFNPALERASLIRPKRK